MGALRSPLASQGVAYGTMKGGVLSGFTVSDVNYNNQVQAKELSLKVDLEALKNRVLKVDNLVLKEAHIDKDFLSSLIDSNSSSTSKKESNVSLPFDTVIVKNADISLENIVYQEYALHSLHLHIDNLKSDLKTEHQGKIAFQLDSNVLKSDLNATFVNNSYELYGTIEGDKSFITPFLKEQNLTLLSNPSLSIKAKGTFQKLNYRVEVHRLDIHQNEYEVHTKELVTFGQYNMEKKDLVSTLKTALNSNVGDLALNGDASLNLNDVNNSLRFKFNGAFTPKESHLMAGLSEEDISIEQFPLIKLLAKGNMNKVDFKSSIQHLKVHQNTLHLNLKELNVKGEVAPLKGDVNLLASSKFDSSVAGGALDLKSQLNFNDINNTLAFTFNSGLDVYGEYLNPLLKENNVTLQGDSRLVLHANGDMKNVEFNTLLKEINGKQNNILFNVHDVAIKGESKPLQGDTHLLLSSNFSSSVADGKLATTTTLNFNNIESSLMLDTHLNVNAHAKYLNSLLKEQDLALKGDTPIVLTAKGSMNDLSLQLDANAEVLKDNKLSRVTVHASPLKLNVGQNQVKGILNIKSDGEALGLNVETHFSGDYTNPKAMNVQNTIEVNNFNAFGLDLTSLKPLALNVQKRGEGIEVQLNSPKINLVAKSSDNDHFTFQLKTDKLVVSKIVKDLPPELKNKFVKVDIGGELTLSKQYFTLKGLVESVNNFKMHLDAKNNHNGLNAKLYSKHLNLLATGNLAHKDIQAKISIDSLEKVQEEFVALYPFEVVKVDGALLLKAKMKGDSLSAVLNSKKLKFDGFNVENLKLDSMYVNELLTINTLNFQTTGFKDKSLNQKFYLNQKGLVHLGEKRDVLLDIHPNIMIKATGTSESLKGDFKISKLPLGHPNYGDMVLNCDIHYQQEGKKKKITGDVKLDKMKLFYEAKFLDADYDSDVIIVTKKDKKKQKQNDSFLKDTFIDLSITAPYAKYSTRDVDLEFTVDVNAKKDFGHALGMLGKIKEIHGRVEQAPKLFNVVDSNIIFGGGKEINPLLDIQVDYELPDVLITILIHGHANRPKLDFASEPPMPKKDILSYLLLGVSTAALSEGKGSLGREAQLFIMNQAARDFAYEVELDRVFIKDDGTGEGYAVQIGKKVNDNTMFVIENSKEGNSFLLEYDVNKHLKVEVGQHQKTVPSQSIDLYFRKRFK